MATPNYPIVNLSTKYVDGLNLEYIGNSTFTITSGQARDFKNINDIVSSSALTINTAVLGANGLDTGTVAASTWYYVYIVGDSKGYNATCGVISTSATPALPAGYDMSRRIGWIKTDGSSHILAFTQTGDSKDRAMWWDAQISVLSGGSSATFAAVTATAAVPPTANTIIFNATVTPTAAGNAAALRPTGSSSTAGYVILSGDVAAVACEAQVMCPNGINATTRAAGSTVDYKVTGTLTLLVSGYVDHLS